MQNNQDKEIIRDEVKTQNKIGKFRVGAGFSTFVQTGPGAKPVSFPEVKRPGRGVNHPPNLAPRLRKE
jgi:hypothetical protein